MLDRFSLISSAATSLLPLAVAVAIAVAAAIVVVIAGIVFLRCACRRQFIAFLL